jgi:hypothetical protein
VNELSLNRRHVDRAAKLRSIAQAGASLVGLWVSGIQRFIFNVPMDKAGLEVKARSFLVALLPKVLAWRARREAALGEDHEVMVAAGRATLLVPTAMVQTVRAKLVADAQRLRDETGDDLAIDLAVRPMAAGESLTDALSGLDELLGIASWRRAGGEDERFWEPNSRLDAATTDFASLGRKLREVQPRVAALGVADGEAAPSGGGWWCGLGVAIAVGTSIDELPELPGTPRLLLRTDEGELPSRHAPDEVASLPLAGTWIAKGDDGCPLEFDGLAERAAGDAKLGVLRLDLDNLGAAFSAIVKGSRGDDPLRDRLALSDAVNLACGPLADAATWGNGKPRDVQWILAGGDDLFLVGAWSEILDVSLGLHEAIVPRLRDVARRLAGDEAARKLNLSGGIVISDVGVPLAHLADAANEQEDLAKGVRPTRSGEAEKGAIAWGGIAVGWNDWRIVVDLGQKLGEAIKARQVPRSVLRRLIGIHTLWYRAQRALDAGRAREAAESSKRQWLWAYALGRARAGGDERGGATLIERLSRLALEDLDPETGKHTEQHAAAWLGIVAEIAHRWARARGEERR